MLKEWDEVLRKIFVKTKMDKIRSQEIRQSCGIQPINERMERRRRRKRRGEWDEYVTRMDTERLVKISRDNQYTSRKKISRTSERRWSDFIPE